MKTRDFDPHQGLIMKSGGAMRPPIVCYRLIIMWLAPAQPQQIRHAGKRQSIIRIVQHNVVVFDDFDI